ncbi:hypothetical protein BGLA2_3450002 [Burkholderia gladioli]|nr:hypothetical protein BGLA2_3450002 [Burkholderia gladioli]
MAAARGCAGPLRGYRRVRRSRALIDARASHASSKLRWRAGRGAACRAARRAGCRRGCLGRLGKLNGNRIGSRAERHHRHRRRRPNRDPARPGQARDQRRAARHRAALCSGRRRRDGRRGVL